MLILNGLRYLSEQMETNVSNVEMFFVCVFCTESCFLLPVKVLANFQNTNLWLKN